MTKIISVATLLLISSLVLSACLPGNDQPEPTITPESVNEVMEPGQPGLAAPADEVGEEPVATTFTLEEVAMRNQADDCWTVIDGRVYDLTAFIASGMHPGGDEILRGCGLDASDLFENRPGSGTPHSAQARANLSNFEIGILVE